MLNFDLQDLLVALALMPYETMHLWIEDNPNLLALAFS